MRQRLIPVLITLSIIVIVQILKRQVLSDYNKRRTFTLEFHKNFISMVNAFAEKGQFEPVSYGKVVNDLDAIQLELGADGFISEMIDPLKGIKVKDYQIFMNIIPEMRAAAGALDLQIFAERLNQMLGVCDDALGRHVGLLGRIIDEKKTLLWNPISCFGDGVRWLIGLPGQLLVWLGIIKPNKMVTVQKNLFFRFFGGLVSLIGLVGSIITILLGWEESVQLMMKLF